MSNIKASIIIPTKDKITRLRAVLKAFENQVDASIEVIVVFDGNKKETIEAFDLIRFSYEPIKLVLEKNCGRSAARNRGIEKARGEIIILVDDDRIPEPDFIKKHISNRDTNTVILGGRKEILLSENEIDALCQRANFFNFKTCFGDRICIEANPLPKFVLRLLFVELSPFQWLGFFTGNISVPKKALDEIGGFDESFNGWGHEDIELAYRLYRHGLKFRRDVTIENYHLVHRNSEKKTEQSIANLRYISQKHRKDITIQVAIVGFILKEHFLRLMVEERYKRTIRRFGARLVARSLSEDATWALRGLYLNTMCGSVLVPRALRWLLYRALGLDVRTPNVLPRCKIVGGESISITIGEGTFMNSDVYMESFAPIAIGRDCHVAMQVLIVTSTHLFDETGHYRREPVGHAVTIGDRVWIGARAIVLPGVTIGNDVVVAAGSVVTKDCEPNGLYGGIPARRIRDLASFVR